MKQLGTTLLRAYRLVTGERNAERGHPKKVYEPAAQMTEAYLRGLGWSGPAKLDAKDMMVIMTFVKISRETQGHHPDNLLDGTAYLAIACDMSVVQE